MAMLMGENLMNIPDSAPAVETVETDETTNDDEPQSDEQPSNNLNTFNKIDTGNTGINALMRPRQRRGTYSRLSTIEF